MSFPARLTTCLKLYEFQHDYSPAWRFVGTHAHWSPWLRGLADDYLRRVFDIAPSVPIPPVRILSFLDPLSRSELTLKSSSLYTSDTMTLKFGAMAFLLKSALRLCLPMLDELMKLNPPFSLAHIRPLLNSRSTRLMTFECWSRPMIPLRNFGRPSRHSDGNGLIMVQVPEVKTRSREST